MKRHCIYTVGYLVSLFVLTEAILFMLDIPKEYKPVIKPIQFQTILESTGIYTSVRSANIEFIYDGNPRGYFNERNIVEHITNRAGMRGPEILNRAPPGSYRMFF